MHSRPLLGLPPGLTLDGTSGVVSGTLLRVVRPRSRVAFTPAAQIGIGPEGTEMLRAACTRQLPRLGIATPAGAALRGHVPPSALFVYEGLVATLKFVTALPFAG